MSLQFFYTLQKCHCLSKQLKSMQLYFVQQNTQTGCVDSERLEGTGPLCIWSLSSALYVIQEPKQMLNKTHSRLNKDHAKWPNS